MNILASQQNPFPIFIIFHVPESGEPWHISRFSRYVTVWRSMYGEKTSQFTMPHLWGWGEIALLAAMPRLQVFISLSERTTGKINSSYFALIKLFASNAFVVAE